jgi:hypothetical protein
VDQAAAHATGIANIDEGTRAGFEHISQLLRKFPHKA